MKDYLTVGDSVFNSPVGPGIITGITDAGYPQVNHIAVSRLVHKTPEGKFLAFNPHQCYSSGDYTMAPVEFYKDRSVVVVDSIEMANNFIKDIGAAPKVFFNKEGTIVSSVEEMFGFLTQSKEGNMKHTLEMYKQQLEEMIREAKADGVVLSIEIVSKQPLAMGNVEMVVDVREARKA
jgi:hypothetical protein